MTTADSDSTTPFRHRLRVRYAETDAGGVAHHGSYVAWLEEARTEWMRSRGRSYRDVEEGGHFLKIAELQLQYLAPSRYDDHLEIEVFETRRRRVSLDLGYEIRRVGESEVIATGMTRLACTDRAGRLRRLPEGV